jgi:hypothetical protein
MENMHRITPCLDITISPYVNALNERHVSPHTQRKNTLGIGLGYAVL